MDEKPRRFRFGLLALFALIAAAGVVASFWNPFKLPPSRANLRLIEDGMTIAEVMALVGPPDYFATNETQTWHAYEDRPRENWVIVFADGKVITNSQPHRNGDEIGQAIQECFELCWESNDAKECARQYVAKLIEQDWREDDASQVLTIALGRVAMFRAAMAPAVSPAGVRSQ